MAQTFRLSGYECHVQSKAGCATCVAFPGKTMRAVFDVGCFIAAAVRCSRIFVTHAHIDHVGALATHVRRYKLSGKERPQLEVYAPGACVDGLRDALKAFETMDDGGPLPVEFFAIGPGDSVKLSSAVHVQPFVTDHRVPSLGYQVLRRAYKLKAEFVGMESSKIGELRREGVRITEQVIVPEVVVTGDTRIGAVLRCEAALRAKLLVMECTGLDDRLPASKCHENGHIHLDDLVAHADAFQNETILLVHFSSRYKAQEIRELLEASLPPSLRSRVAAATSWHEDVEASECGLLFAGDGTSGPSSRGNGAGAGAGAAGPGSGGAGAGAGAAAVAGSGHSAASATAARPGEEALADLASALTVGVQHAISGLLEGSHSAEAALPPAPSFKVGTTVVKVARRGSKLALAGVHLSSTAPIRLTTAIRKAAKMARKAAARAGGTRATRDVPSNADVAQAVCSAMTADGVMPHGVMCQAGTTGHLLFYVTAAPVAGSGSPPSGDVGAAVSAGDVTLAGVSDVDGQGTDTAVVGAASEAVGLLNTAPGLTPLAVPGAEPGEPAT